jgi:transcriptional regulator with XRE-family HTH domain
MPVDTVGTELLKERFLTKAEVARRVGVSHQVVSDWAAGMKRPAPEHREILQREFGIPVEAWLTPDERTDDKHEFSAVVAEYMRRLQAKATELLASIARKTL